MNGAMLTVLPVHRVQSCTFLYRVFRVRTTAYSDEHTAYNVILVLGGNSHSVTRFLF